jgi:hypothetical protein
VPESGLPLTVDHRQRFYLFDLALDRAAPLARCDGWGRGFFCLVFARFTAVFGRFSDRVAPGLLGLGCLARVTLWRWVAGFLAVALPIAGVGSAGGLCEVPDEGTGTTVAASPAEPACGDVWTVGLGLPLSNSTPKRALRSSPARVGSVATVASPEIGPAAEAVAAATSSPTSTSRSTNVSVR